MFLGSVAAQPLSCDLKFTRTVAKGHESENPEQDADCLCADVLDSADIHGLAVVTKPVAKIDLRS
jgi:hypothetical protein